MPEEEDNEQIVEDFEEKEEEDEEEDEEEEEDEDLILEHKLREAQSRLSYGPFNDKEDFCSPRIKELARPPDRWLLELYEHYREFMTLEKRKRIKRRIQEINMLTADDLENIIRKQKNLDEKFELKKCIRKANIKKIYKKLEKQKQEECLDKFFKKLSHYISDLILKTKKQTIITSNTKKLIDTAYYNICKILNVDYYTHTLHDVYIYQNLSYEIANFIENVLYQMNDVHSDKELSKINSRKCLKPPKMNRKMLKKAKHVVKIRENIAKMRKIIENNFDVNLCK